MTPTTTEQKFLANIARLMDSVYVKPGYRVSIDQHVDITHGPTESITKLRQAKLALNLNLFKNNVYLTDTKDYLELGNTWKSLDPHNLWGGDSGFGCIFAMSPENTD